MFQDNQKDQLEKLLTRLIDSYDGYQNCIEHVGQNRHEKMFKDFAATRQKFANEIREIFTSHGEDADTDGSFLAKAHRVYTDLKLKMDSDDEELLEAIHYGEGNLVREYKDTIECFKSNPTVLEVLQRQYQEIQNDYELISIKEKAA